MCLETVHRTGRHALFLSQRHADGEDLLTIHDRLCRYLARQGDGARGGDNLRIDPEDGDIAGRIGSEDARRYFHGWRQLNFRNRAAPDDPLSGCDQPVRVDEKARSVRGRRPHRDNAVLPLRQEEGGIGLERRGGTGLCRVAVSTSAFSAFSSRTALRPATILTVCVQL